MTGLRGRFPAVVCAAAMARGTLAGQSALAQQVGEISGTVRRSDTAAPLDQVAVRVAQGSQQTVTDSNGSFTLQVPPGDYVVVASLSGFATTQMVVTVAAGRTASIDFELFDLLPQFGEEIVVIGSRAERTAVETPVPVDVLGGDEIRQTGMTETSRIIQFLAPSFNFSTSTISDGTDIVRPSTLRGLGPVPIKRWC